MDVRDWRWLRLERAEVVFAVFKTLAFAGAVAALFLAPVRPEHQVHLLPLLAFFFLYHLLLYGAAIHWPGGCGASCWRCSPATCSSSSSWSGSPGVSTAIFTSSSI